MRATRMLFAAALCFDLAAVTAPDRGPWFGTPVPPPANDPARPVITYDSGYATLPAISAAPAASTRR